MRTTNGTGRTAARRRGLTATIGLASASAVSAAISAPATATAETQATVSTTVTMTRSGCIGGGRLQFTLEVPTAGRVKVTAVGARLPNGQRWTGQLIVGNTIARLGPVTTRHRGFTVGADVRPGTSTEYTLSMAGPHDRSCQIDLDAADPLVLRARCQSGAHIGTHVRRPAHGVTVLSRLAAVHPGSRWTKSITVSTPHEGTGATGSATADENGVVTDSLHVGLTGWTSISSSFMAASGRTCGIHISRRTTAG